MPITAKQRLLSRVADFVLPVLLKVTLAFLRFSFHTKSMQPTGAPPQPANTPQGDLNWDAIHAAYAQHLAGGSGAPQPPQGAQPPQPGQQPMPQVGGSQPPGPAQPFVPQPEAAPGGAMVQGAMANTQQQPGEDQGGMIIRALSDQLKRITPDVNGIHKQAQQKPNTGGGSY